MFKGTIAKGQEYIGIIENTKLFEINYHVLKMLRYNKTWMCGILTS